jgi:hypothetical protein
MFQDDVEFLKIANPELDQDTSVSCVYYWIRRNVESPSYSGHEDEMKCQFSRRSRDYLLYFSTDAKILQLWKHWFYGVAWFLGFP